MKGNVRKRVTYSRVRETIVTVEKQHILHIPSVSVALVIEHAKSLGADGDVPCGRRDGQRDTKKVTVAFRNFANVPNYVAQRRVIENFCKKL